MILAFVLRVDYLVNFSFREAEFSVRLRNQMLFKSLRIHKGNPAKEIKLQLGLKTELIVIAMKTFHLDFIFPYVHPAEIRPIATNFISAEIRHVIVP